MLFKSLGPKVLTFTIALAQGVIPTFWQLNQLGPVQVEKLTYESDIPLDPDEFRYLFNEGLKSGLTHLARKQKFSSVTLTYTPPGKFHLKLVSRWSFKKLTVRGVSFGRDAIAQHYDLEPGDPFDEHKHEHGVETIRQSLIDQGYCGATVQAELVRQPTTKEVEVVLMINRGRRFLITEVTTNEVCDRKLAAALQEITLDLIGRRYTTEALEKYEQALREQLAYHGYHKATLSIGHQINPRRRAVIVTTTIEPGEQRIFEFVGAHQLSENDLKLELAHLGISAALLPPELLADEVRCIYHKRGYPGAEVAVTEQGNRTTFSIGEGAHVVATREKRSEIQATVTIPAQRPPSSGKLVVAGVCPVPFRYMLREASRLRELDLFDLLQIYPDAGQPPAQLVRAVLRSPFELRLRAGVLGVSRNFVWKEGATYKVGGSLAYRNVANRAGQFRIDGDVTKFEQRIAVQYQHPWFFGFPYRAMIKGYYNRYNQPVLLGRNLPLYIAHQQGCVFSLSRTMRFVSFGINTGLEWLETSVQNEAAARAINFLPVLNNVTVPYLYCEPTLILDFLDDKVNPTKGAFTLATLKGMVPLATNHTTPRGLRPFVKVQIEQSFFARLGYSCVAGMRVRAGHVFNADFSQIMPPDRFLLGGAWSVRGYEPDHVPPLGKLCDPQTGKIIFVPQGSKTMANVNLELRFPLWRKISGTLFQDFGFLDRLVAGSGFGVRYHTPVGPLRFDLGFKWGKKRPEESRAVWYLTLGNAF